MSSELKAFELRHAPRPLTNGRYKLLSSAVAVTDNTQDPGVQCYCYVAFTDALVKHVGKKLPRGIMESDPAYLDVRMDATKYRVFARYATENLAVLLWEGDMHLRPDWLKRAIRTGVDK